MITGQSLIYALEDGKTTSCEDFSFRGGVTYIPFRQKDIFDTLSFAFSSLSGGSLSVDGVSLTPTGFVGGTAKMIKLNVKDTGSLTLVMFYSEKDKTADASYQKLVSQLKALKFPTNSEEDKKDKMAMLKTVLSLNPVSYILIDFNDSLTQENQTLWELMFIDYKGAALFLSENHEKEACEAKHKSPIGRRDLYLPYRIPLLLTSFFAIFLCAYSQSLKIGASSKWGFVLAGAIVFLIGNIVISAFLSKKETSNESKKEYLFFSEIVSLASSAFGLVIALFAVWLFSSKTSVLAGSIFQGLGLALMTLFGTVILFAPLIVGHTFFSFRRAKRKGTISRD